MVESKRFVVLGDQVVIHTDGLVCGSGREVVTGGQFRQVLSGYLGYLFEHHSHLSDALGLAPGDEEAIKPFCDLIITLQKNTLEDAVKLVPGCERLLEKKKLLHGFAEGLYDYWRSFDRFMVLHSMPGPTSYEYRPYRVFNATVDAFSNVIRGLYRDTCENITGDHPRVYRQVAAGCNVGIIAVANGNPLPPPYRESLTGIPTIRQVLIIPPFIIDPPMNKRTGQFQRINENPLQRMQLTPEDYLCYPVQVGPLVIFVYFHQKYIGLASSMANLFELATDEQVRSKPDAIFVYGCPDETLAKYGQTPTVFYDDEPNQILAGFVPLQDRFGYFGYVKKMVLTLHNIVMMKRGRMPFHGAMTRMFLNSGEEATILLIGDTATGKSETLEALRRIGKSAVRELVIIADDMGSLAVAEDGKVIGFGTETGAFIRLDDLQQGYAFGQIDRAIIMSPHKVNARVVLPVTSLEEVLHGYPIDFLLYANNYEAVDESHPVIERFSTVEEALAVFKEGASMSKGTTTSTGLVHSYFANIFGPVQYRRSHDQLAQSTFKAAMDSGVFVGQMRTRLGIPGCEQSGPAEASKALLQLIQEKGKGV